MMMTREEIKKIVYNCAENRFYDKEDFKTYITNKSYDGENELIYSEVGFDSLDMIEFIMDVEQKIRDYVGHVFTIEDSFIDLNITLGKVIDYIYERVNKE